LNIRRVAAVVFVVLASAILAFQMALALGAPWGEYAMGGAFPGRYPTELRVAAMIQATLWVLFACVILARAGMGLRPLARAARWMAWIIVALTAVSLVLNLLTPSAGERMLWSPVAFVLLVCSVLVATGPSPAAS
jgi:hypothetical protein